MQPLAVHCALDPADTRLIRSRPEAASFFAQATHELAALRLDGYTLAAGGIPAQVPEDQAEDARPLLKAADEPPA